MKKNLKPSSGDNYMMLLYKDLVTHIRANLRNP